MSNKEAPKLEPEPHEQGRVAHMAARLFRRNRVRLAAEHHEVMDYLQKIKGEAPIEELNRLNEPPKQDKPNN